GRAARRDGARLPMALERPRRGPGPPASIHGVRASRHRRTRRLHRAARDLLQHAALSAPARGPCVQALSRRPPSRSASPRGTDQLAARAGLRLRAPPGPADCAALRLLAPAPRSAMIELRPLARDGVIVGGVYLALVLITAVWLAIDRRPPEWDHA